MCIRDRSKTEALQTAFHKVSEAMYEQARAQQPAEDAASANGDGPEGSAGHEDDVVDAEVVEEGR